MAVSFPITYTLYSALGGTVLKSKTPTASPLLMLGFQTVGQKENPKNFLLMHAMGPNVAGVIGSAIAAGVMIALFG